VIAAAIAALLFLAAALPVGNGLHWRSIGPSIGGGRTTSVAGSNHDPFLYYFGAMDGGVWKTADGGSTWTDVWGQKPVGSIGAVAIAPSNDSVVWVGTGESNSRNDTSYGDGVWVSTDGGKTFVHRGLDKTFAISRILVSPTDPRVALVGAVGDFYRDTPDRGLYRTADGGRTWTKTLYVGAQSGVSDIASDPSGRVVFAGVWQFHRMPWDFASGGPFDGLYRSRDFGKTWVRLHGHGLPGGLMGRIGVSVSRSDPRVAYATIQSKAGTLWRSSDGGDTWRLVSKDTYVNQRPFYMSHIVVDPIDPDHVLAESEDLAESRDGGKSFDNIDTAVHQDHHDLWWSNDGRRLIEADDGGAPISVDGGRTWMWRFNVPIGQVYHVGYDLEFPYHVCGGLQDNDSFCGPSDSLNPLGILDSDWRDVGNDGDGSWVWPDRDPTYIWNVGVSALNGQLGIYDTVTRENVDVTPSLQDTNGAALAGMKYRYNWQAPIALAPLSAPSGFKSFQRETYSSPVYYGANVVFVTVDHGELWSVISPDLTLNDPRHQQRAGGPINTDVSGAEFFDTLVDIAPSSVNSNVIWVGTDDGLLQLTRDSGAHWKNVTMRGIGPYGRVECVEPSSFSQSSAFAVVDRHMMGDRHPYIFATDDYGSTWRPIVGGLPDDEYAHVVRQSPRNPDLLFAGLEQGVWVSFDRGAHWQSLQLDMPPTSAADLRIQPEYDDLVAATHGRSFFILDDLRPLEQLASAHASSTVYLFKPRSVQRTWRWWTSGYGTGGGECCEPGDRFAGDNPSVGAIVSYYLSSASPSGVAFDVLDAKGHLVSHFRGPSQAGVNRTSWDLTEPGPVPWFSARPWNQGPSEGAVVVPGVYKVRMRAGSVDQIQPLEVIADMRSRYNYYDERHDFTNALLDELSSIDIALNDLDARAKHRPLTAAERSVYDAFTSNPRNSEDDLLRPDRVREMVQTLLLDIDLSQSPPTDGQRAEAARIAELYSSVMARYRALRVETPRS
jgi:hypothetical protein